MLRFALVLLFAALAIMPKDAEAQTDVTAQISITTPVIYNPAGPRYYDKWRQENVQLTNAGPTINGMVLWTFVGLPDGCTVIEAVEPSKRQHVPIINGNTLQLTAAGGSFVSGETRSFNIVFYESEDQPSYTSLVTVW